MPQVPLRAPLKLRGETSLAEKLVGEVSLAEKLGGAMSLVEKEPLASQRGSLRWRTREDGKRLVIL